MRITLAADDVRGSRVGMFRRGRRVSADVLLHGALRSSGDDALGVVLLDSPDPARQARFLLRRATRLLRAA